jgi:hypothetical protein
MKLTTHLHIVQRSMNVRIYTSMPHYTFMAWCSVKDKSTGTTLPFYLYLSIHCGVLRKIMKQLMIPVYLPDINLNHYRYTNLLSIVGLGYLSDSCNRVEHELVLKAALCLCLTDAANLSSKTSKLAVSTTQQVRYARHTDRENNATFSHAG